MVFLHVLGGLIVFVGLILFVMNQMRGSKDKDAADVSVWKINLSGPPALVLIVVGVMIAMFPFTSWFQNPTDPNPPEVSTTTSPSETTVLDATTTLIPEIGFPLAPDSYFIEFDETCQEDAIFWTQPEIENVNGWWLSFESYNIETDEVFSTFELDTAVDTPTFGNFQGICELDFVTDVALNYWIWIYSYNDAGFSEPLFLEYLDS